MFNRHKSPERVKAYLLGRLDDDQAAVLEEKYFSEPAFLHFMREGETQLIQDYLKGKLSSVDLKQFEQRYLVVPALEKRLEEVRRAGAGRDALIFRWKIVSVFAALICCVATWMLWRGQSAGGKETAGRTLSAPPVYQAPSAMIAVTLEPGMMKGVESRRVEFKAPPGGRVQLHFELPGRKLPVAYRLRLRMVQSDGRLSTVWTSESANSSTVGTRQEAMKEIESSKLPGGDYVGEVLGGDGSILESYSFRIL